MGCLTAKHNTIAMEDTPQEEEEVKFRLRGRHRDDAHHRVACQIYAENGRTRLAMVLDFARSGQRVLLHDCLTIYAIRVGRTMVVWTGWREPHRF